MIAALFPTLEFTVSAIAQTIDHGLNVTVFTPVNGPGKQ